MCREVGEAAIEPWNGEAGAAGGGLGFLPGSDRELGGRNQSPKAWTVVLRGVKTRKE